MKVMRIPIVIGTLGTVTNELEQVLASAVHILKIGTGGL